MTIVEMLKQPKRLSITNGSSWLWWNDFSNKFVVVRYDKIQDEHPITLIETDNEEAAVAELLKDN